MSTACLWDLGGIALARRPVRIDWSHSSSAVPARLGLKATALARL
jgi:hypothetical protein